MIEIICIITLWIYTELFTYLQASPMVANVSYPLSENRKDTLAVKNQVAMTYLVRKGKSGKKTQHNGSNNNNLQRNIVL